MKTDQWNLEDIKSFDGRRHLKDWKPLRLERFEPQKGLELGDAPGFYSHIPIISKKAWECLKNLIDDEIELLSISFDEGEYFIINVLEILDCIDYERSEYKTFSDGRIMRIKKYEFIRNEIYGKHIFKLKDFAVNYAFVSDEFKSIVERNDLHGFKFVHVWSDEQCTD